MINQQTNAFGLLPALKHLGELSDVRPTIIIDSREQRPLSFKWLKSKTGMLVSGDYSVAGLEELFAVERKTIPDLIGCGTGGRERFERELCRLKSYQFARLLIVGTEAEILSGDYHSAIRPKAVIATLRAFEVRYVPVVFADTPEAAAQKIESWVWWFAREMICVVNDLWRASSSIEKETMTA
jgi:ERCC4-type nuclease